MQPQDELEDLSHSQNSIMREDFEVSSPRPRAASKQRKGLLTERKAQIAPTVKLDIESSYQRCNAQMED